MADVAMRFETYRAWSERSVPSVVTAWLGDAVVARHVEDDFIETVTTRTSGDGAATFMRHCPVPGATPDEYRLRELEIRDGLSVLAGIHFLNGAVERPFVGVYAQSRSLRPGELEDASARLLGAFERFGATRTWWWESPDEPPAPSEARTIDTHLVAGRIEEIRRRPRPPAPVKLELRPDRDGATFPAYVDMFGRYLAANPFWQGRLAWTTEEDYRACAEAGGLFVVEHEGRTGGVIAARPGVVDRVPGWEMMEEILDVGLRGRGLAAHVQRQFLERLDVRRGELILGSIDDANVASLRTALRVGRATIGRWIFVGDGWDVSPRS